LGAMGRRGRSNNSGGGGEAICIAIIIIIIGLFLLGGAAAFTAQTQIGKCAFQGPRFPRFELEGKPPRRVFRREDELTLCRAYRKRTCCAPEQTNAALVSIKKLAIYGEGSADCVSNWEAVECSICDPQVGVFSGPPLICSSLCRSLYESCLEAYFANDPTTQVLVPCGPKDVVCAQGREWASNSSGFCRLAGFEVELVDMKLQHGAERLCYKGGAETFSTLSSQEQRRISLLHVISDWIDSYGVPETVLWAFVALSVITGATLLRCRNITARRKRNALVEQAQEIRMQREGRMLMLKSISERANKKLDLSTSG